MTDLLARQYAHLVSAGRIERDAAQETIVAKLDALLNRLQSRAQANKGSALGWLFGKRETPDPIRGLYIWGSVGRGKTMLMDMFFEALSEKRKRRAHFHAFMADVHERIHAWRQAEKEGKAKNGDPIKVVAEELAAESIVLCFDEFAVNDIADAMILGRLFDALFKRGVVLIATSNVDPADLYAGGLNRALFLPFIAELQQRVEVLRLDARTDFRLEKLAGNPVYYTPADEAAEKALDKAFQRLAGDASKRMEIAVHGRKVIVPRAAGGVARFSFSELCEQPLGASDYIALAHAFHTMVIGGIPALDFAHRNEAKRFITLIDVLYEHHVKVIVSADAGPTELYTGTTGREAFEFERTSSRLIEMQSDEYLAAPHGRVGPRDAGDTGNLVET